MPALDLGVEAVVYGKPHLQGLAVLDGLSRRLGGRNHGAQDLPRRAGFVVVDAGVLKENL